MSCSNKILLPDISPNQQGERRRETVRHGGEESEAQLVSKNHISAINMTMANVYHIYGALVTFRTPDWGCIQMKDAIRELSFALMQRGYPMQTREAPHPKAGINLSRVLGWTCGKKVRSDSKREVVVEKTLCQETWSEYKILRVCVTWALGREVRLTY